MNTVDLKKLEEEIIREAQQCSKCKMCASMCPTYEGWLTQSASGKLQAIYYHLKYGLGTDEELRDLLYSCTTCGRCKVICKLLSGGCDSTGTIIKARNLLVEKSRSGA